MDAFWRCQRMPEWGKWNPIRIPDGIRQHVSHESDDDPMQSWNASDWDDPDASGWIDRIKPSHLGQWLLLGAALLFGAGFILWTFQFSPITHRNPWTFVAFGWPGSLAAVYVVGREHGFTQNEEIDWTFITTGRSIRLLPGEFVERFGNGEIKHIRYNIIKSRSYGAFKFNFLKLGDLDQNREDLMTKAKESNRGPDSKARMLLPGTLTGEDTDTILGRVFGVHGSTPEYIDNGSETDMRVTNPNRLDDDIAKDVLKQLEMFDRRIIPELKSEIETLETLKERYKTRAEAERDPELDRIFGAIDTVSNMMDRRSADSSDEDEDSETDEITERAREQVSA